jgi:hypothetical protein
VLGQGTAQDALALVFDRVDRLLQVLRRAWWVGGPAQVGRRGDGVSIICHILSCKRQNHDVP